VFLIQLIGADPIFDVALLKVAKPSNGALTALKMGDSDSVRVGEDGNQR